MYKGANENAQKAATKVRLSDLERGDIALTDEQRRDSLKARLEALQLVRLNMNKASPRFKETGREIAELCAAISAIRPKKRCPGVEQHFINVVRESVTKAQFNAWMGIAAKRLEADGDRPVIEADE